MQALGEGKGCTECRQIARSECRVSESRELEARDVHLMQALGEGKGCTECRQIERSECRVSESRELEARDQKTLNGMLSHDKRQHFLEVRASNYARNGLLFRSPSTMFLKFHGV